MRLRRRIIAAVTGVGLLVAGSAVAAPAYLAARLDGHGDDGVYTLLVLGSDAGPPRPGSVLTGRSDGLHLVSIVPETGQVAILSFPRDSWVDVVGMGKTKVNAALTRGPEITVATMEAVTGIDIDDWIVTGFHGLISAVDELGGVEIDVERRLNDPKGAYSDLHPGVQVLDGDQALAYVRDRKSRPDGDFGRAESHARMLQALHAQVVGEDPSLARLAELASLLRRHTATSMSTARTFALAALAVTIDPANVTRVRVDGQIGTAGAASVVYLTDTSFAQIADIRDDGVIGNRR